VSDPPHHYHFQIFALDTELRLPPGVDRRTVAEAMSGHVLAKGELIGTVQKR
jgi:nitroreductase